MVAVSIITCTMRTEPKLEALMDCLESQTYRDFEYIIVDGKLDKIPGRRERWELARKAHSFPVKVVGDKPMAYKLGLSNARNSGLIWADGRIVVLFDDLITFGPELVAGHAAFHPPDGPRLAIAGVCHYVFPGPPGTVIDARMKGIFQKDGLVKCRPEWLYGMNASFPMDAALKLNGFDERFGGEYGGDDCDFSIRMARAGYAVRLAPGLVVNESRDGALHNDLFVTENVAHEDWWCDRTKMFHWRNEQFIEELLYTEPSRHVSKNRYSLAAARANRIAGSTAWDDVLKGA